MGAYRCVVKRALFPDVSGVEIGRGLLEQRVQKIPAPVHGGDVHGHHLRVAVGIGVEPRAGVAGRSRDRGRARAGVAVQELGEVLGAVTDGNVARQPKLEFEHTVSLCEVVDGGE